MGTALPTRLLGALGGALTSVWPRDSTLSDPAQSSAASFKCGSVCWDTPLCLYGWVGPGGASWGWLTPHYHPWTRSDPQRVSTWGILTVSFMS